MCLNVNLSLYHPIAVPSAMHLLRSHCVNCSLSSNQRHCFVLCGFGFCCCVECGALKEGLCRFEELVLDEVCMGKGQVVHCLVAITTCDSVGLACT